MKIKVIAPLYFDLPRKPTKKDPKSYRRYYLNLNNYRNWNPFVSNKLKQLYAEAVSDQIRGYMFHKVDVKFTYYKADKRRRDKGNVLSIHEKFFLDALVHEGCIVDDNDEYVKKVQPIDGGIDKHRPRVEIEVTEADF